MTIETRLADALTLETVWDWTQTQDKYLFIENELTTLDIVPTSRQMEQAEKWFETQAARISLHVWFDLLASSVWYYSPADVYSHRMTRAVRVSASKEDAIEKAKTAVRRSGYLINDIHTFTRTDRPDITISTLDLMAYDPDAVFTP